MFSITILSGIIFAVPASASEEKNPDILSGAVVLNRHYYKAFNDDYTWEKAKSYCEALGGHLMTITSKKEQEIVSKLGLKAKTNYWLGATDEEEEGTWKWVTGEKWSYTLWGDNEPDNSQKNTHIDENYLQMCVDWDYKWNDSDNTQDNTADIGFICEWDSFKIESRTTTGLKLKWGMNDGAVSYEVKCSKKGSKETVKNVRTNSCKISGLAPGTEYTIRILAVDDNDEYLGCRFTYKVYTLPKKGVITKLKAKKKSITVKYKKRQCKGYVIRYSKKKNMSKAKKKTIKSKGKLSATLSKLKRHKKYYVQVRCYVNEYGKKYYGKWSKTKKIKTK